MLSDLSLDEFQLGARLIGFDLDAADVIGLDDSAREVPVIEESKAARFVRRPPEETAGTQRGSVAVTTFDTAAAWQKTKPIALALCASWLAFGLAGCETANSLFSSSVQPATTPTASVAPPPPNAASGRPAQIAIAPVIGPPEAVSKELQTQLIADIERQNIRVAKSPGEAAEYTLRGYVVSSLEKKGPRAKISYIWDVTDGTGKGVHRVSGEETAPAGKSQDPWTAVTPPVIEAITAKTVASIATWLPTQAPPAVASTTRERRPRANRGGDARAHAKPAYRHHGGDTAAARQHRHRQHRHSRDRSRRGCRASRGAPGDGSSSLRMALQRELSRNGVALADTPRPRPIRSRARSRIGAEQRRQAADHHRLERYRSHGQEARQRLAEERGAAGLARWGVGQDGRRRRGGGGSGHPQAPAADDADDQRQLSVSAARRSPRVNFPTAN